jgi:hypothetical protein
MGAVLSLKLLQYVISQEAEPGLVFRVGFRRPPKL